VREPLYSTVASRVETFIRSGEWAAGARLPPERELCRLLDVSRATLRQALAELEQRGLIDRHQGRGTFVTNPRIDADISGSFTLAAALQRHGLHLATRVVGVQVTGASRHLAEDLACRPGDPLLRLVRVRSLADGEPLLLETTHLPLGCFPGLESADFSGRSLYEILRTDYGTIPSVASESLEPICATAAEAFALRLPRRAPVLLIHRVTRDERGAAVETSHALLRGDRCRFLLTRQVSRWGTWLRRQPGPSSVGRPLDDAPRR
jgi:DNA-binding GntR family transcriptional regulator